MHYIECGDRLINLSNIVSISRQSDEFGFYLQFLYMSKGDFIVLFTSKKLMDEAYNNIKQILQEHAKQ